MDLFDREIFDAGLFGHGDGLVERELVESVTGDANLQAVVRVTRCCGGRIGEGPADGRQACGGGSARSQQGGLQESTPVDRTVMLHWQIVSGPLRESNFKTIERSFNTALLTSYSLNSHLQAVEPFAGSNEQGVTVFSAKTNVGGPTLRHVDLGNLFAGGIKNRNPVTRDIDIPFIVDGHAIRTRLAKELFVRERPISVDAITKSLFGTNIGDVEDFSVRGPDDAVRLLQVINDPHHVLPVRREKINVLAVLFRTAFPIWPLVLGICETSASVRPDPNVIWPVEELSLIVGENNRDLF